MLLCLIYSICAALQSHSKCRFKISKAPASFKTQKCFPLAKVEIDSQILKTEFVSQSHLYEEGKIEEMLFVLKFGFFSELNKQTNKQKCLYIDLKFCRCIIAFTDFLLLRKDTGTYSPSHLLWHLFF